MTRIQQLRDRLTRLLSDDDDAPLLKSSDELGQPEAASAEDHEIDLNQSRVWSRLTLWALVSMVGFGTAWVFLAQIEEAVQVQGKLEPIAAAKDILPPVTGVVETVEVKDGQRVRAGQVLVRFDTVNARGQVKALGEIQERLANQVQVYRAQLGEVDPTQLTANQQRLLEAARTERSSRQQVAALDAPQARQQLEQSRLQATQLRYSLTLNRRILSDLTPLVRDGGIARTQYLQQEEKVAQIESDLAKAEAEAKRLQLAIQQAEDKKVNTTAQSETDLRSKIEETQRQLAEVRKQLTESELLLRYQVLKAPVPGTVFDVKAQGRGYVASPGTPLMKIVPDDRLVARVFVTNKDIGFIRVGQTADIRIDSYPFSQFGDIQGTVHRIGSDVLPPDEIYQYYRFPAEITLASQSLNSQGRQLPLQSGMSISASIRLRQRPVITLLTDLFSQNMDALKGIR